MFDNWTNPARGISQLSSNISCNLFGWGSENPFPRMESVRIYGPEFCDPTNPNVFCSTFPTENHATCTATLGSPVVCDSNNNIAGILNSHRQCTNENNQIVQTFISLLDFHSWILCVSTNHVQCDASGNLPGVTTNVPSTEGTTAGSDQSTTEAGMTVKVSTSLILAAFVSAILSQSFGFT